MSRLDAALNYKPKFSGDRYFRTPRPQVPRRWLKQLFKTQRGRCFYCTAKMYLGRRGRAKGDDPSKQATFDHMIPLSRGGEHSYDNGCAACAVCNNIKKSKTPAEYKVWLKSQKYWDELENSLDKPTTEE